MVTLSNAVFLKFGRRIGRLTLFLVGPVEPLTLPRRLIFLGKALKYNNLMASNSNRLNLKFCTYIAYGAKISVPKINYLFNCAIQSFVPIKTSLERGYAKGHEIHIRELKPETKLKLNALAKSEGMTINNFARKILEQAVGEDKKLVLLEKIHSLLIQKIINN